MGSGFYDYKTRQFTLYVSLRYAPEDGEISFWCQLMGEVSRLLHDATDGQHSIGQVFVSANSLGSEGADIWVHPSDRVLANSKFARLWIAGQSLDFPQDDAMYPTLLLHELGHYLYGLRDEYTNDSKCQGNIATQASVMEAYPKDVNRRWTDADGNLYDTFAEFFKDYRGGKASLTGGEPTEFCHAGNHNTAANNKQNNLNGKQSCWTYMANDANHNNIAYGLTEPGAGGPARAAPAAPAATVCTELTELIPVQRFMLALDRAGSTAGAEIAQLKIGASFWVDYVNQAEELGLTTFSGVSVLDSGMSAVPAVDAAWRTARHTIVDGIAAGGAKSIDDVLRTGLARIIAGGRASSQVMILFSGGLQTTGVETAVHVLPDLVSAGVRCYTIGFARDQDAALLANIANNTNARYIPIDGDLDPDDAATAITEALIYIAGESRENGGVVSFDEIDGASADVIVNTEADAAPYTWFEEEKETDKSTPKPAIRAIRFPVTISEGSTRCTLGALFKHTKEQFKVRIFNPAGQLVNPGPTVRHIAPNTRPYGFYEVDNPMPGRWMVEIHGAVRQAWFRTIGFEVNNQIRLEVSALASHIVAGAPIHLRGRLCMPHAVSGATFTGLLRSPSGKWTKFRFTENTGAPGDLEEEFVYTADLRTNERGQYLIAVTARRAKGTFNVELDKLYRLQPGLKPADMKRTISVPATRRIVLLTVTADREGLPRRWPPAGSNPKPAFIPPNHAALLERWKKAHPS